MPSIFKRFPGLDCLSARVKVDSQQRAAPRSNLDDGRCFVLFVLVVVRVRITFFPREIA